jgi:hypothetical protein
VSLGQYSSALYITLHIESLWNYTSFVRWGILLILNAGYHVSVAAYLDAIKEEVTKFKTTLCRCGLKETEELNHD